MGNLFLDNTKNSWYNWLAVLWCTQMRESVEKVYMLIWNLYITGLLEVTVMEGYLMEVYYSR